VTIGMNMRNALSAAVLALAMAVAIVTIPGGARADSTTSSNGVAVCNTASNSSQGGEMQTLSADPQTAVHNTQGLRAKQNANLNAAMHSRALSLCGVPYVGGPDSGGGA
jgi:hypothetical protein